MAIKPNSGRQEKVVAILDINFDDPIAYGAAEPAIEVPANAIVLGGDLVVKTAWNSATSAAISLGDAGSATRYLNAVDLKIAGRTALTLTGYKHTVTEMLKALLVQAGAGATAGAARVTVEYAVQGRVAFAQGLDFRGVGVPGA